MSSGTSERGNDGTGVVRLRTGRSDHGFVRRQFELARSDPFPVNYLLIESLQKFHHYLGPSFRVECPTGSGRMMTLAEVAAELSRRLSRIFLRDEDGRRPVFGDIQRFQRDPHWRDYLPFHEYFHGDNGRGVGASHQTGWTGLVAKLLQQSGE
jgi:hypothetical protein